MTKSVTSNSVTQIKKKKVCFVKSLEKMVKCSLGVLVVDVGHMPNVPFNDYEWDFCRKKFAIKKN